MAKSTLLTVFFETYLRLDKEQEQEYRKRLPKELTSREVETYMQLTTSYHEEGKKEGLVEGKKEGLIEGVLDLLGDKEDFSLFSGKLIKELGKQTELETLKTSLRRAAKASSIKHFLEESNGEGF